METTEPSSSPLQPSPKPPHSLSHLVPLVPPLAQQVDRGQRFVDVGLLGQQAGALGGEGGLDASVCGVCRVELADSVVRVAACCVWMCVVCFRTVSPPHADRSASFCWPEMGAAPTKQKTLVPSTSPPTQHSPSKNLATSSMNSVLGRPGGGGAGAASAIVWVVDRRVGAGECLSLSPSSVRARVCVCDQATHSHNQRPGAGRRCGAPAKTGGGKWSFCEGRPAVFFVVSRAAVSLSCPSSPPNSPPHTPPLMSLLTRRCAHRACAGRALLRAARTVTPRVAPASALTLRRSALTAAPSVG